MAAQDVLMLRRMTNEPADESDYADNDLQFMLDQTSNRHNRAAARVWREKAAKYADLVNTTEGTSSRQWSKAYEQALAMAKEFDRLADEEEDQETPAAGGPTIQMRKIIRT